MKNHLLVLLDFDGTLAATEKTGWDNISTVLAAHFGADKQAMHDFVSKRHGQTIEQYYPILCRELGVAVQPDGAAQIKADHTATLLPRLSSGVPPAGNLIAALASLREDIPTNYRICSNSITPRIEASIDGMEAHSAGVGAGLRALISGIHSAISFKPDPEVFVAGLEAEANSPAAIVVVEDSATGLAAGLALRDAVDIPVCLIGTTALRHDAQDAVEGLRKAGADHVVHEDDWHIITRHMRAFAARHGIQASAKA